MERNKRIEEIERQLVGEKPWYEKGEVSVKERPKGTLVKDTSKGKVQKNEEQDDLLREDIEITRNKRTVKITEEISSVIDQVVLDRIKKKEYDNPRKQKVSTKKEISELLGASVNEEKQKEERAPLHDLLEGRKTVNDSFMGKEQLISLLNEIDKDLSSISDESYVVSRPISL
ncbi:hypothetical protein NEFER03_0370 [Nematocida sp. LUAm3]|nr:hypothetical protein NEFER03_0370 [Nematocida sp. LUAm3]KAI5176014.1 hypothetical protein NEFER02_1860 [Nematocida sp. LUAm2]KAI5179111.1 hypothetical protein NEFER01_1978 [Nematocida sp. LUAm1]